MTDGKGIPLGIVADGANRHDIKLARETLENIQVKRPKPTRKKKQNLCLDAGYVVMKFKRLHKSSVSPLTYDRVVKKHKR